MTFANSRQAAHALYVGFITVLVLTSTVMDQLMRPVDVCVVPLMMQGSLCIYWQSWDVSSPPDRHVSTESLATTLLLPRTPPRTYITPAALVCAEVVL